MKEELVISQTIAFPVALRQKLVERAKKEGVPISSIVQRALLREFSEERQRNKKRIRNISHASE